MTTLIRTREEEAQLFLEALEELRDLFKDMTVMEDYQHAYEVAKILFYLTANDEWKDEAHDCHEHWHDQMRRLIMPEQIKANPTGRNERACLYSIRNRAY